MTESSRLQRALCGADSPLLHNPPPPPPPPSRRIINFTVEKCGPLKERRGGWEPAANGEALINNPSAQPGANIAPIDEIVRVSFRLFDCGGARGGEREGERERSNMGCLQRERLMCDFIII